MLKRFFNSMVIAGFAAMLASSSYAADVSISGTVEAELHSYTSNFTDDTQGVDVNETGASEDTYSHMTTDLYEAEMKFKTKGETPNGWKTYAEIEFELGQGGKNDFELEEASANVEFGAIKLSAGILEDWSQYTGEVYRFTLNEKDTKFDDETGAIRFAFVGSDAFYGDVKLRMYQDEADASGDTFDTAATEMRIQAEFKGDWGSVSAIYATLTGKGVDSDAAGDYDLNETAMNVTALIELGVVSPFVSYTSRSDNSTSWDNTETEDTLTEMMLGINLEMGENMELTANYMQTTLDFGGDDNFEKSALGAAFRYSAKPVKFELGYTSASNNASTVNDLYEDATYGGFIAALIYKF